MTGGVLFDFDGTLVNTFDDIIEAIQRMRAGLGEGPLPPAEVRRHIGWGAPNLIAQCHPEFDAQRPDHLPPDGGAIPLDAAEIERGLQRFRQAYSQVLLLHSRPYPGMATLCRELAEAGLSLAVVSNKPEGFTRHVLAGLGMVEPIRAVVGGDTIEQRKPDRAPLDYAAKQLGLPVERCVMVGDSSLDVQAAQEAGIPCCAVTWGILSEAELIPLGPAHLARSASELGAWIRKTLRILAYTHPPQTSS